MAMLERTERYSTVAMWFHWIIAAFVIVNLAIGLLHENLLDGVKWAIPLHKSIGMTVLVLTAARVAWRIVNRPPPLPAHTPGWEKGLAHATHWVLYLLMIAMPVTGWMMVSGTAKRYPFSWFGVVDLPYLPISKAAGGIGHNAHGLLGWLMLALVVLHVAAALRHRFILRDQVLGRMGPALNRL